MIKSTAKLAFVFGAIFSVTACAFKPELKVLDPKAPTTAINSPAQAAALQKMHSK